MKRSKRNDEERDQVREVKGDRKEGTSSWVDKVYKLWTEERVAAYSRKKVEV